ncbi:hypothetical protein ACEQ8H_008812 [Pleosporales sp. CAS-2024a]
MGYYNMESVLRQKRLQGNEIKAPPMENILAAAEYVRKLFDGKRFNHAFMGRFAMLCLGHKRHVFDLQVTYDDKDFYKIKSKLNSDHRVPRIGTLTKNTVILTFTSEKKLRSYKSLNKLYLIKTLVHYCNVQGLAWDPRTDLLFLCQHYGDEVKSIRAQLDPKTIQLNFLGTHFFTQISLEDQRRCYQTLLGTDPPPTMAITPPPLPNHKHSASDSEAFVRPRMASHKSTPSLNGSMSSALLSPPLAGKPRAASNERSVRHQISELPATMDGPSNKHSEILATTRESRTRYRPMSAFNARTDSSMVAQALTSRTAHIRQHSQPPPISHQPLTYDAPLSSHLLPFDSRYTSLPIQSQRLHSIPRMMLSGPIPPYAFSQTPALNNTRQHISTTNPGQNSVKSQHGLNDGCPAQRAQVAHNPMTERPIPPQERSSHQAPRMMREECSEVGLESTQRTHFYVAQPDMEGDLRRSTTDDLSPNPSSTLPVELDSTTAEIGHFIAELSAGRSTPAPERKMVSTETKPTSVREQVARKEEDENADDAVANSQMLSFEFPVVAARPQLLHQHQDMPIRPLNPRTSSAPAAAAAAAPAAAALPVSLMAGGASPHRRIPSVTSSTVNASFVPSNTNESKYTHFVPRQAWSPSSLPATTSTYRAYQPKQESSLHVDGGKEDYFKHKRDSKL